MSIPIIVSTCDRRELTAICLESVKRCAPSAPILIVDDDSREYSDTWLQQWGTVMRNPSRVGVGENARLRFVRALEFFNEDRFLFLDNDALARPGFYEWTWTALDWARTAFATERVAVTPYRSSVHVVREFHNSGGKLYAEMEDAGGISLAMDRATVTALLANVAEPWDWKWDYAIMPTITRFIAPQRSFLENTGRYGGGVNGETVDHGVGYWEG